MFIFKRIKNKQTRSLFKIPKKVLVFGQLIYGLSIVYKNNDEMLGLGSLIRYRYVFLINYLQLWTITRKNKSIEANKSHK